MTSSLKTRFVLVAGLLACASIAAVAIALRQSTRQEFFKFQDLERRGAIGTRLSEAARLAALIDGRCCDPAVISEAAATLPEDLALIVVDSTGAIRAQAGAAMREMRRLTATVSGATAVLSGARQRGARLERFELKVDGMGVPLTLADGSSGQLFLISLPGHGVEEAGDGNVDAFLGSIDRTILWATILCGIGGIALTWVFSRRVLKPIDDLGAAARAIAAGNLSHRAPVATRDELGELARAFNMMATQLERQETLRRNMLHDVAHELRTPLTALRCRIETIVDGLASDPRQALAGANDEVLHLGRLVDDLQELALADAGELRLDIADASVAAVTASALAAAGLKDDPRLRVDIPSDLIVRADPVRLRQILLNLLTNADRHTPAGHHIAVRGRADGAEAVIEVANTGSSLDDAQRERVFDRFYRGDSARQRSTGGSGLGLAIVKSLVEAQGGKVSAEGVDGETTFVCRFPVRPHR
jgi:signal transduction histidine kinase